MSADEKQAATQLSVQHKPPLPLDMAAHTQTISRVSVSSPNALFSKPAVIVYLQFVV